MSFLYVSSLRWDAQDRIQSFIQREQKDMSTRPNTVFPEQRGGPARQTSPLWRNRDYLLLIGGQGVSAVGSQISLVAFPLLIFALTRSPAQTGLMA